MSTNISTKPVIDLNSVINDGDENKQNIDLSLTTKETNKENSSTKNEKEKKKNKHKKLKKVPSKFHKFN